jgi:hypothetical protein
MYALFSTDIDDHDTYHGMFATLEEVAEAIKENIEQRWPRQAVVYDETRCIGWLDVEDSDETETTENGKTLVRAHRRAWWRSDDGDPVFIAEMDLQWEEVPYASIFWGNQGAGEIQLSQDSRDTEAAILKAMYATGNPRPQITVTGYWPMHDYKRTDDPLT